MAVIELVRTGHFYATYVNPNRAEVELIEHAQVHAENTRAIAEAQVKLEQARIKAEEAKAKYAEQIQRLEQHPLTRLTRMFTKGPIR